MVLHNGSADKPTKEDAHIIIDVMHEIVNEEIAVALNLLIETLEYTNI